MQRIALALVTLIVTVLPAAAQSTVSIEEIADIGNPDNAGFTAPFAINNHGHIVGTALTAEGVDRAFVWTPKTGFELIAHDAIAWDINDRGQVVGEMHGGTSSGFLWTRRNGFTYLGSFLPFAINKAGVMAGVCVTEQRPCVWQDGEVRQLEGVDGVAYSINDGGDVVGVTSTEIAFLWTRTGEFVELGTGVAEDINNRRMISGVRRLGPAPFGTVWFRGRVLTAPGETSGASKINQRGWVLASTDGRPFVWNPRNDATVALRISQGGAPFPFDLNDRGYVVGLRFEGDISHILIWQVRSRDLNTAKNRTRLGQQARTLE